MLDDQRKMNGLPWKTRDRDARNVVPKVMLFVAPALVSEYLLLLLSLSGRWPGILSLPIWLLLKLWPASTAWCAAGLVYYAVTVDLRRSKGWLGLILILLTVVAAAIAPLFILVNAVAFR